MTYVEEVIPESLEVIEYRLSQLCDFLEGAVPPLFSLPEDAEADDDGNMIIHSKITADDIIAVLTVMEEEFTPSDSNGMGLVSVIQGFVADHMEDRLASIQEEIINSEDFDEDDGTYLVVSWQDMYPILSGDLGLLFEAAGIASSLFLSAGVHSDPEYHIRGYELIIALTNTYPYFKGAVMFLLVLTYIYVSRYDRFPTTQQVYLMD